MAKKRSHTARHTQHTTTPKSSPSFSASAFSLSMLPLSLSRNGGKEFFFLFSRFFLFLQREKGGNEEKRWREGRRWCGDEAPSTSSYTCRISDECTNIRCTYGGRGGCWAGSSIFAPRPFCLFRVTSTVHVLPNESIYASPRLGFWEGQLIPPVMWLTWLVFAFFFNKKNFKILNPRFNSIW